MKQTRIIVILVLFLFSIALIACGETQTNVPSDKTGDNQNGKSTYRVSFKTNGAETISDKEVDNNCNVEKPDDPTKEGYIFGGWYSDGKEYDFNTPVNSDLEL